MPLRLFGEDAGISHIAEFAKVPVDVVRGTEKVSLDVETW